MAESPTTSPASSREPRQPATAVSLEDSSDVDGVVPETAPAEDPVETLRRENADLKQQQERWRAQVNGSRAEWERTRGERDALTERIARLEGRLSEREAAPRTTPTSRPALQPGEVKDAFNRWINGDNEALNAVEQVLLQAGQPTAAPAGLKPEDISTHVDNRLREWGTRSTVQTLVQNLHPDLKDRTSPLYQAIWEQYDAFATDPINQLLYPNDPRVMIPLGAPDGMGEKQMDGRILRQMVSDLRVQHERQEGRREATRATVVGTVGSGNGRSATSRTVEAVDLLTQGERDEIINLQAQKAWPKDWPKDMRAAAKFIYDGLSIAEKARRLDAYKRNVRTA